MNRDYIKKTINKKCLELGLTPKEFEESVIKKQIEYEVEYNPKDKSTYNKWYNGKQCPEDKMLPIIAKALDMSYGELIGDESYLKLEEEINILKDSLECNENERKLIMKMIYPGKASLLCYGIILMLISLFFLNFMTFNNPLIYLSVLIAIIYLDSKDNKNFKEGFNENENQVKTKKVVSFISYYKIFFKYLLNKSIVSVMLRLYLVVVIFISFIPFLESICYRGSFHITSVVYMLIGISLIIKSHFD